MQHTYHSSQEHWNRRSSTAKQQQAGWPGDQNSGFSGILGSNNNSSLPSAFLTWRLYNRNYNLLNWGSKGVTSNGSNAQEHLVATPVTVEQPGYIYITLYDRSASTNFVYFDDFTVTQTHSRVVSGSDYYPFGLVMDGTEITDETYRQGYQGQFSEKDLTTGWNEFELRMYDARFGRWLSVDPEGQYASPYVSVGNNPAMNVDPDGGFSPTGAVIGAIVGAATSFAFHDQKHWYLWAAGGALAGGIAGEWAHSVSNEAEGAGVRNRWDKFTSKFGEGELTGGRGYRRFKLNASPPKPYYSFSSVDNAAKFIADKNDQNRFLGFVLESGKTIVFKDKGMTFRGRHRSNRDLDSDGSYNDPFNDYKLAQHRFKQNGRFFEPKVPS